MSSIPSTTFDTLMRQLSALPLWIKQVIYIQLRHDLEVALSRDTLKAFGPEHTLQLWIPELTRQGAAVLEDPDGRCEPDVMRLLRLVRLKRNVLSITILNNWSLEHSVNCLLRAIESLYVSPPRSVPMSGTIDYLAGRIRLGEYLVKINRISIEQLDQGLRTQRAIAEAMGEQTGIADVLINLGYIKREDSEAILFLKEESRKPFQWTAGEMPAASPAVNGDTATAAMLQQRLQQAVHRIRELETLNRQLQQKT